MPSFKIYEPHPSTKENSYIHSGRGGAGNHFKAPATTSPEIARGPASLFTHGLPKSSSSSKFSSGRGGAGNMHPVKEKEVYNFDEELTRRTTSAKKAEATRCHIGRGGAGNWERKKSSSAGSESSGSDRGSVDSRRSGLFGRVSGSLDWVR